VKLAAGLPPERSNLGDDIPAKQYRPGHLTDVSVGQATYPGCDVEWTGDRKIGLGHSRPVGGEDLECPPTEDEGAGLDEAPAIMPSGVRHVGRVRRILAPLMPSPNPSLSGEDFSSLIAGTSLSMPFA
jgi:hypothetical protein